MRTVAAYAVILAATLALFLLAPQTDLWVSALFYQPQHGFTLRDWEPLSLSLPHDSVGCLGHRRRRSGGGGMAVPDAAAVVAV